MKTKQLRDLVESLESKGIEEVEMVINLEGDVHDILLMEVKEEEVIPLPLSTDKATFFTNLKFEIDTDYDGEYDLESMINNI